MEKEMATHSSVLPWRIPGMGEPGGLPSVGSQRVRHNWSNLAAAVAATLWTVALQTPLSMEFSRQAYWNVVPFPSLGDLPDPGLEAGSPAFQTDYCLSHQVSLISLKDNQDHDVNNKVKVCLDPRPMMWKLCWQQWYDMIYWPWE